MHFETYNLPAPFLQTSSAPLDKDCSGPGGERLLYLRLSNISPDDAPSVPCSRHLRPPHSPPAVSHHLLPLWHSPRLLSLLPVCSHLVRWCPRFPTLTCCCAPRSASGVSRRVSPVCFVQPHGPVIINFGLQSHDTQLLTSDLACPLHSLLTCTQQALDPGKRWMLRNQSSMCRKQKSSREPLHIHLNTCLRLFTFM